MSQLGASPGAGPTAGPIADLTYRTYDGPLNAADRRWWAIAKMSMRLAVKRKGFWIWAVLSGWWYVVLMAVFYFADVIASNNGLTQSPLLKGIVWPDLFVTAFSFSQLLLFVVALLIGIGTIANDNRANALLIYLSKPCTKGDYLLGKWLGIFIPIAIVSFIPMTLFYAYAIMSFRDYGSFSSAPWLYPKLVELSFVSAFLHASLCVGISSMFVQGRLAGATYSGIYFISNFFTVLVGAIYKNSSETPSLILHNLYYLSIDGLGIGAAKLIIGTNGSPPFVGMRGIIVPRPDAPFEWLIYFGACALSVLIAWLRIRPVEVVG